MLELRNSKREIIAQALENMHNYLGVPDWDQREKIVLAARILAAKGHDSGLAGQITARNAGMHGFITQKFGVGFDEIELDDLLHVDDELNVLEGSGMPNPANLFHAYIYRMRPDVMCIIHTHPLHTSALSMLGIPLVIAHMDTCGLYDDVAFLSQWPGVPVAKNEGEIIAAALGHKRAILLAHHGLLIAAHSVEEACVLAIQFERAAELQLLARAAGKIQEIEAHLGKEAHDWLLAKPRVQATFYNHAKCVIRRKHSN